MNILSRCLAADDVVLGLDTPNKLQVLEEIALRVERRHHIDRGSVLRALWRREQIGSTGIGHGIAIPHARIAGISEPIVLFVRTRLPIKFGSPDHLPVATLFVILVPESANDEHLQILAAVSERLSDDAFRQQLEAASDASAILHLFADT